VSPRERDPENEDECLSSALSFLSYRPRTARETRQRARRWGYSSQTVESVVGRLRDSGLIDDERFARTYMEEMLGKGLGERTIRVKMLQKGLDRELVAEVLEEYPGELDGERALQAALKRFRAVEKLRPADMRRISDFLMRRGFSGSTARSVARLMADVDSDFWRE
jgi:regulatory protein